MDLFMFVFFLVGCGGDRWGKSERKCWRWYEFYFFVFLIDEGKENFFVLLFF